MNISILMLAVRIALAFSLYAFLALVLFSLWRAGGPPRRGRTCTGCGKTGRRNASIP
jgi:hypothetical protein